jgi:hypothetical protein
VRRCDGAFVWSVRCRSVRLWPDPRRYGNVRRYSWIKTRISGVESGTDREFCRAPLDEVCPTVESFLGVRDRGVKGQLEEDCVLGGALVVHPFRTDRRSICQVPLGARCAGGVSFRRRVLRSCKAHHVGRCFTPRQAGREARPTLRNRLETACSQYGDPTTTY